MTETSPDTPDAEKITAAAKRAEWSARIEGLVKAAVMAFIGLAAGRAAFTHMHDWTMESSPAGTPDWFGWSNAIISELIPLVALLDIRAKRRNGKALKDAKFAVVVLVVFVLLSLGAQISQALHTPAGWLIAALPALGFLVVTKLVLTGKPSKVPVQRREPRTGDRPAPIPAPEPAPIRPVPTVPVIDEPPPLLVPVDPPREAVPVLEDEPGSAVASPEPEPTPAPAAEVPEVLVPVVDEPRVLDVPDVETVREHLVPVGLASLAAKVADALGAAAGAGRSVSVDDLMSAVKLPRPLAEKAHHALNGLAR